MCVKSRYVDGSIPRFLPQIVGNKATAGIVPKQFRLHRSWRPVVVRNILILVYDSAFSSVFLLRFSIRKHDDSGAFSPRVPELRNRRFFQISFLFLDGIIGIRTIEFKFTD